MTIVKCIIVMFNFFLHAFCLYTPNTEKHEEQWPALPEVAAEIAAALEENLTATRGGEGTP